MKNLIPKGFSLEELTHVKPFSVSVTKNSGLVYWEAQREFSEYSEVLKAPRKYVKYAVIALKLGGEVTYYARKYDENGEWHHDDVKLSYILATRGAKEEFKSWVINDSNKEEMTKIIRELIDTARER